MKQFFLILILILLTLWIHPISALIVGVVFSLQNQRSYYELIGVGILSDIAYQTMFSIFGISIPLYTLIAIIIFILLQTIKKRMNFYA